MPNFRLRLPRFRNSSYFPLGGLWAFLDNLVLEQTEVATLRKCSRLLVKRAVSKFSCVESPSAAGLPSDVRSTRKPRPTLHGNGPSRIGPTGPLAEGDSLLTERSASSNRCRSIRKLATQRFTQRHRNESKCERKTYESIFLCIFHPSHHYDGHGKRETNLATKWTARDDLQPSRDVKVNLVQPEANSVCEIGRLRDGQLGKFFVMFEGV
jgi:hypothetical protein